MVEIASGGTWWMRISFGNEENAWLLSLVAFPSSLSSSYTRTFVDGRVTPGSGNAIQGVLCNDTDARNFRARQFDDNATPNESSMRAVSWVAIIPRGIRRSAF